MDTYANRRAEVREAVAKLYRWRPGGVKGIHLVKLETDTGTDDPVLRQRPVDPDWAAKPLTEAEAAEHAMGGWLGYVPASMGMVVVTLDWKSGPRLADAVHAAAGGDWVRYQMPPPDGEHMFTYVHDGSALPEKWAGGRLITDRGWAAAGDIVNFAKIMTKERAPTPNAFDRLPQEAEKLDWLVTEDMRRDGISAVERPA